MKKEESAACHFELASIPENQPYNSNYLKQKENVKPLFKNMDLRFPVWTDGE